MKLFVSSLIVLLRNGEVHRPVDVVRPTPSHPDIAKVSAAHAELIGPNGAEIRADVARAMVVIDNEVRHSYEFPDLAALAVETAKRKAQQQELARQREGAQVLTEEKQLREQLADLEARKRRLGIGDASQAADDPQGAALSAKAAGEQKPSATTPPEKPQAPAKPTAPAKAPADAVKTDAK